MKILLFTTMVLLLSCGQNSDKQKKVIASADSIVATRDSPNTNADSTVIQHRAPDEALVNASLSGKYGNLWHVLNDGEAHWMKDAFDYFIVPKRKTEANYPYITRGDFNADGNPDIAAVITDSLQQKYQVAILLDTTKIIFWDEDILDDAALSTVPKSIVEGIDGEKTKKVKMKGDGINVEYFEKASFVLYWEKAGFKRLQTGD